MAIIPVLEDAREKFSAIVAKHKLGGETVQVKVSPLSAKQAIGSPSRQDFALLEGKEVMIEAQFRGSFGQAFTDQPQSFEGTIGDVLESNLSTSNNRAIFVATLNAVTANLGIVTGTRHCQDDEPEKCAAQIADNLMERFGRIKVGLVGYQPAILEHLIQSFGVDDVRCSDLNPNNIGSLKFGSQIYDGKDSARLIEWCDLLLVTSSTLVNDTFDEIRNGASSQGKHLIIFGVTTLI